MPLYLHPPSDCANMRVCVAVSGCLSECVVEYVCFLVTTSRDAGTKELETQVLDLKKKVAEQKKEISEAQNSVTTASNKVLLPSTLKLFEARIKNLEK